MTEGGGVCVSRAEEAEKWGSGEEEKEAKGRENRGHININIPILSTKTKDAPTCTALEHWNIYHFYHLDIQIFYF